MIKAGQGIDLTSVVHQVAHQEMMERVGGAQTKLYTDTSTSYNIEHHATIVKELSVRRKLMQNANIILKAAHTGMVSIDVCWSWQKKFLKSPNLRTKKIGKPLIKS